MASVDVNSLSKVERDQLVCGYAALLLHDDGQDISVIFLIIYCVQAEKLAKVIKASGNEVEAFWPNMFANALKGQNIEDLLTKLSQTAVAVGGAGAGAGAGAQENKAEDKKEAKKEEKEEEEADVDMGGLFGDDY